MQELNKQFSKEEIQIANKIYLKKCLPSHHEHANWYYIEIHSSLKSEWLSPRNKQQQIAGKEVRKEELLYIEGENVSWHDCYGNQCGSFSNTKTRRPTIQLHYSCVYNQGYLSQHIRDTSISVYHCTIHKNQGMEQPKCPSTDDWIKKTV